MRRGKEPATLLHNAVAQDGANAQMAPIECIKHGVCFRTIEGRV